MMIQHCPFNSLLPHDSKNYIIVTSFTQIEPKIYFYPYTITLNDKTCTINGFFLQNISCLKQQTQLTSETLPTSGLLNALFKLIMALAHDMHFKPFKLIPAM